MHDLMAVAPVVKEARAETLGNPGDIYDPAQHRQCIHGDEVTQRGGTPTTHTRPTQQKKREAEKCLPGKGTEASHSAACCDGTVDGVTG